MSEGAKLPRAEVLPTAERFVEAIGDVCSLVAIAGSLRRQVQYVSDIEVVAIPKTSGLFDGAGESRLDARLQAFVDSKRLRRLKNGERYKQFDVMLPCKQRIKLDLFITDPDRWPVILAIRTGPASFSKAMVTDRTRGGLLRAGLRVSDGYVWDGAKRLPLATEEAFFELAGGWVEPSERR